VKISHQHFWSDAITLRPFEKKLKEYGIVPLKGLVEIIQNVHVVLKTSEMLNQLEENCTKAIGIPPCPEKIIEDFLLNIVPYSNSPEDANTLNQAPDYEMHMKFIGLECSLVADAIKSIIKQRHRKPVIMESRQSVERFLSMTEIPSYDVLDVFSKCLRKWYNPIFEKAKDCITRIFNKYQVDESIHLFREIVLGLREDFALKVVELSKANESKRFVSEASVLY
jgi:hypothetical protein